MWQPWVVALDLREQRALASALRGADDARVPHVKQWIFCLREETENVEEPHPHHYFGNGNNSLPSVDDWVGEIEKEPFHFVQHQFEALWILQREKGEPYASFYAAAARIMVAPLIGYPDEKP